MLSQNLAHNKNGLQVRRCIYLASAVFMVSIFVGYVLALASPAETKQSMASLFSSFDFIRQLNPFYIFLFIFLNNSIKGLLIMLMGIFFAIVPIMFIFINGELIGILFGISGGSMNEGRIFLGLLPHGILEIPAILIAAGYGIWLGYRLYRWAWYRDSFEIYVKYALKKFFKIVIPMLLAAACIETLITPHVINALK